MKKFTIVFLPVLIFSVQAVISLPTVSAALGVSSQNWQLGLAIVLVTTFAVMHVVNVGRPYERFARFEAARMNILDLNVKPMINDYRPKYDIRINVMLPTRRVLSFQEPWKGRPSWRRPRIGTKHLKPAWVSDGMRHHGDSDIILTVNQGACGMAYREKEPVVADLAAPEPRDFNLNARQKEKSAELKFVLSFPIRRLDPKTLRFEADVLGVVNIDSRSHGSEQLIRDREAFDELSRKARSISELCSQLF